MSHSPSAVVVLGLLSFCLAAGEAHKTTEGDRRARPQATLHLVTAIASGDDVRGKGTTGAAQSDAFALRKPNAVAVDRSGRIFVADPAHRGIVVYDRRLQTAVRWTGNEQFPLFGPAAIALDEPGGRVFVTDVYKSHVIVFREGVPMAAFGKDVLKRPEGIAIDARRGRVYVGDMRLNQIVSFDVDTLAAGRVIGASLVSGPANIAVSSKGELYVSDQGSCRIQVFDPDGKLVRGFSIDCKMPGVLAVPIAIGRDDRLYAADPGDLGIDVFDTNGKAMRVSVSARKEESKPFVRTGIAVDTEGRIYIAEQGADQGRVQIFEIARMKHRIGNAPGNQ